MPSIESNQHTLLQGLSDFWIRFYKDTAELDALYRGTEVLLAQVYLDLLSSFLNISVVEMPIFNTELFKLITIREDEAVFDLGATVYGDRYRFPLPDNVVEVPVLQNKVIDPTASLEVDAGYEVDKTALDLLFWQDPTGQPGEVISTISNGYLLAYGLSADLKRFYVTEGEPFARAKPGYWFTLGNSGTAPPNDATYRIAQVIDPQTVLLQNGTSTSLITPDPNSGSLTGYVSDSEFSAARGFAHRILDVAVGGSFDDATTRGNTEIESWYAKAPAGLGVRKGDILRILDRAAVATVPTDLTVAVVRHNKLYVSADTPVLADASAVANYVVLREGPDPDVNGEVSQFTQVTTGIAKTGITAQLLTGNVLEDLTPSSLFVGGDRQRFITLDGCGAITWTASLARDGTLTRTGGMFAPLARAFPHSKVLISGSVYGNNGTFELESLLDTSVGVIIGETFLPEPGLSITLVGVTNDGTYRVRSVPLGGLKVELSLNISYPDPNAGAITWTVHDGYQMPLAHSRVVRDSVDVASAVGSSYTGGARRALETTDYVVQYETGSLLQVGYLAGTWGLGSPGSSDVYVSYRWLMEVFGEVTAGNGTLNSTDITVTVNETALWAPDARVDRFNLYNNYGYLLNRFDASSEHYREFIRGVFQLYLLGPTMERLESALNVIAGFPVVRDDGEVLQSYSTTDPDFNIVTTLRLNRTTATYAYPKGLLLRSDVQDPANYGTLTFESFEALTLGFNVSDYVEDPSWYTDIVVPRELMPSESVSRRHTYGALIENSIGAWDGPEIGDPGLFIGADDEGIVPPFIATRPALRRKMANVVMNTFLKWHVFFVRFDQTTMAVLDPDFVQDLVELILIAKPGYCMMFIEPLNSFKDTLLIKEDPLRVAGRVYWDDTMILGEDSLTIQSFSWTIGDYWRAAPAVIGQALVTADGATVPNGGAAISLGATNVISKILHGPAHVREDDDYDIDYAAGTLTPKTVWPSGVYTIDLRNILITPRAGANLALGDTPFSIGCPDPKKVRVRREYMTGATLFGATSPYRLYDPRAAFTTTLHRGQTVQFRAPFVGQCEIIRVLDAHTVILQADPLVGLVGVADVTGVVWTFPSEEPRDGELVPWGSRAYLQSASAQFRSRHKDRRIRVVDAVNPSNNRLYKIVEIIDMTRAVLFETVIAETNVHWRMEGAEGQMDLVERPLQIAVSGGGGSTYGTGTGGTDTYGG
jgi:hypothetical protein